MTKDLPQITIKTGPNAGTIIDRFVERTNWSLPRIYYRRAGFSGPWAITLTAALRQTY